MKNLIFIKKIILLTAALLLSNVATAKPLKIIIAGSEQIGIPIKVLPFTENFDFNLKEYDDIANVISNDLRTSGQVRIVKGKGYQASMQTSSSYDKDYWKSRGTEYLITGNITKQGEDSHTVEIELINVYLTGDKSITKYRFTNQKKKHFRALAHHISDKVFKRLIGFPGIFSTRIAYITVTKRGDETIHSLTVSDSDGHNDKVLVRANYPLMSPAWSPDGKKIAYVSFKNKRSSIKVVNLKDGTVDHLTSFPGINGAPAWSPDGKKLAVVLSKSGYPKIYTIDLRYKRLKRITSGMSIDTEPCWTPDSRAIMFTSNRGGKPQIYKYDFYSRKISRITFSGNYNATPSITPDGKNLVMMHRGDGEKSFNIAVQSLASGELRLLTRAKLDESPSLAPNGMMVLYGSREANRYILGAVSLDGRFRMRLPSQDGSVKDPAWSPYLIN